MMVPFEMNEKLEADLNMQRPYSSNSCLALDSIRYHQCMSGVCVLLDLIIPRCLCEDARTFESEGICIVVQSIDH